LREHIIAGDIFQAIASQRQEMRIESSPLDVYRALRTINPSPYMFYFRHENLALVGSSPEILVKLEGGRVRYRPLAGTRWRGKTEEEDARIAAGLLEDPKERAEHIMLVDLGRNDVGRVCKYNTVEVTELMAIERYSHVMHIVSNIEGEIDPKYDPYDLLRAVFPAGTVSGAPKVRAMQLIDRLEPTRRGPYGGAVGYFGFSGNLDCGIILRTIVIDGGRAYIQSGAGIVYDSDPEYEYNECMNKARGLVKAIEMAEQGELRESLGRDRR
jgi:anthranilate synthase component 1